MLGYSIKDLERLSGVKAHTIRIWEKRYEIIKPKRTDTNIRLYDDEDLKRILNIAILKDHGYKISAIASLTDEQLSEQVLNFASNPKHHNTQVNNLILSMIELDDRKFDKILTNSTVKIGFEETILYVIYPFLEKIGILWQIGSINAAQEHFVTNLLRQKLIVAIDGQLPGTNPEAKRFLLFLPEQEFHEIGLLFYAYLVRKNGHKTIYLGQSVPFEDVIEVSKLKKPHAIVTSITAALDDNMMETFLSDLEYNFPKQEVYLTGMQAKTCKRKLPSNFHTVNDVLEFKKLAFEQK